MSKSNRKRVVSNDDDLRSSRGITKRLIKHIIRLSACRFCPQMIPPVVSGKAVASKVMLIGQAPGVKEGGFGKPFAWTAGKTLFRWFELLGMDEEHFRSNIYMAAVCRCFPGKENGHDRVPSKKEIVNCSSWMKTEFSILQPDLIIPVGKLAIQLFLPCDKLDAVVGKNFVIQHFGHHCEMIPLPHPSGASTWHRREPGISLLQKALKLIKNHPAFINAGKR